MMDQLSDELKNVTCSYLMLLVKHLEELICNNFLVEFFSCTKKKKSYLVTKIMIFVLSQKTKS